MRSIIVSIMLLLCSAEATLGDVYTIRSDGAGDYPTISSAMNAAADGDTIELEDGVYVGEGNRELDYQAKRITIRSLSGDYTTCIIDCEEQGRGFFFHSGEGRQSVLEGVTVTRGAANGPPGQHESVGGAIYSREGSSPSIVRCAFTDNSASYTGGAVALAHEASPLILDCIFEGNTSEGWGGAITIVADSYPELSGCLFSGNTATMAGGAVLLSNLSSPTFDCCTFDRNESQSGGAVDCQLNSAPHFRECTFYGNSAADTGACIRVWAGCFPTLENSILAFSGVSAVVFCMSGGAVTLTCCDLYANEGGDWIGCISEQFEQNGNISVDPLFCSAVDGDFSLHPESPCLPFSLPNQQCGLIGASAAICEKTSVEMRSWGSIKSLIN